MTILAILIVFVLIVLVGLGGIFLGTLLIEIMIENFNKLSQDNSNLGADILNWFLFGAGSLIGSAEQVSKRGVEDKCIANGLMLITAPYHAYLEVVEFASDADQGDFEAFLHLMSTLQFVSDFILAFFGLAIYCQFEVTIDLAKIFEDLIKVGEDENSCSEERVYKIVQSETNLLEIGENIF